MLQKEGQVRIPAGCAISGIFHKDGTRENGTRIIDSIRTMHDRSNGLGGGFAGYGIYPEYADYYAFHVFYDTQAAKEECEHHGCPDDLALLRYAPADQAGSQPARGA